VPHRTGTLKKKEFLPAMSLLQNCPSKKELSF